MSSRELSNARFKKLLALWQAPIDVYGRVLDEASNAVPDATITLRWYETPSEGNGRAISTHTDSEGLFSLQGKRGQSLEIWVSKAGYYASGGGHASFSYSLNGNFTADPSNPIVFFLRKKGVAEPLIHIAGIGMHTMRDYLLAVDGTPTEVSLRSGRLAVEGRGDLRLKFHAGPPLQAYPRRIRWRCAVTVPGGGLIETADEFPFLAPEAGYNDSDEWAIGTTNWTEEVRKQYYLKLPNGDFARVNLRVVGTTRPFCRLESFLNPSGCRNLEFDPTKNILPSQ